MLKIYKRNGNNFEPPVTIRPIPLISISHTPQKNQMGTVGCVYNITLNGTIIAHDGSPSISQFINGNVSTKASGVFTNSPVSQNIELGDRLKSIILKQNALRDLFSNDGNKIEISSINNSKIIFVPNFTSINFEEGLYIDTCKYTVNLESSLLFDASGNVYTEALIGSTFSPNNYDLERGADFYLRETNDINRKNIDSIINRWGGIVEDFSDTWSIETDEANGQTIDVDNISPISYIVTRNMSATGKTFYDLSVKKYEAWEQALGFIKKTLLQEPQASPEGGGANLLDNEKYKQYPGYSLNNLYANGSLNLPSFYRGYNHVRTLNIDKTAGSCSVSDTWLLASGQSHLENYTINIGKSIDSNLFKVKIDGTITGLSDMHPRTYSAIDINYFNENNTPYAKAINKYNNISNNGLFGFNSILYNRASNACSYVENIHLNAEPLSVSIGSNENAGTITYSLEFDNRPTNVFGDSVLFENISVSDNYPGDVFAIIPVIGRQTGPILQYIKGRTEYSRSVNIELILNYEKLYNLGNILIQGLPPSSIYDFRTNLVLNKPSLNNQSQFPLRNTLENLILSLSPSGEQFVTAYYLKPPVETWTPREGKYTLNLNWEYVKSI